MKNTGNVWTVVNSDSVVAAPALFAIHPFTANLYWDVVAANYTFPAAAQCPSGAKGRIPDGTSDTDWSFGGFNPSNEATFLELVLYYLDGAWKLNFRIQDSFDSGDPNPEDSPDNGENVITTIAEAVYVTEESRCLVTEPATFTLESSSIDNSAVTFEFPSQLTFYHTKLYD